MTLTDPHTLLSLADEAHLDGKKVVFHRCEEALLEDSVEEGACFFNELTIEVEGEVFYRVDNDEQVHYGQDTDDKAWLTDLDTGKQHCLVVHTVDRKPVQAG